MSNLTLADIALTMIVIYVFARMANLADHVYEIESYCRNLMNICKNLKNYRCLKMFTKN